MIRTPMIAAPKPPAVGMRRRGLVRAALLLCVVLGGSAGCARFPSLNPFAVEARPPLGTPGHVRGFIGAVVADEPRAAMIGRDILSAGGTATDAAVAAAFAMTVTLPSRAGLGGGGICLTYAAARREVVTVAFPAGGRTTLPPQTDRPAAIPLMARGLYMLHARGGRLRFEQLVRPAEDLARWGTEISRPLAEDLAAVAEPLLRDPAARHIFATPAGTPLRVGEWLVQPDLAATLAQLRVGGVGELYQGALAARLVTAAAEAGGGVTSEELRSARPQILAPERIAAGADMAFFPPAAADGGAGTAAAFSALRAGQAPPLTPGGPFGATAGLLAMDREGNAIACAFSMNNLFGTGRVAAETGILLAAAPQIGAVPAAPLAVGLVVGRDMRSLRAAAAASGQEVAGAAVALILDRALRQSPDPFAAIPDPGRALLIDCPAYVPGGYASCRAAADPRGGGVAMGIHQL